MADAERTMLEEGAGLTLTRTAVVVDALSRDVARSATVAQ
jgi:hypothetical protein